MDSWGLEIFKVDEKKELTLEDIRFNGTGGIDIVGEWIWSGNYEMTISRNYQPTDYNFYANISRKRSRRGNTTGWYITMYMSMVYSNGSDILVLKKKLKTLKSVREAIFNRIKELNENREETEALINEWKSNRAKPVFVIEDIKTQEPRLIGSTYNSVGNIEREQWFNDDASLIEGNNTFYNLSVGWSKEGDYLYISKTNFSYGGYSSSTEKNPELVEKMIGLIKGNPKYEWMIEKTASTN